MIAPSDQVGGSEMDSSNLYAVGVRGEYVVIIRPLSFPLTKDQALNLAAWLAVLADPELLKFQRLVYEIKKS